MGLYGSPTQHCIFLVFRLAALSFVLSRSLLLAQSWRAQRILFLWGSLFLVPPVQASVHLTVCGIVTSHFKLCLMFSIRYSESHRGSVCRCLRDLLGICGSAHRPAL